MTQSSDVADEESLHRLIAQYVHNLASAIMHQSYIHGLGDPNDDQLYYFPTDHN